MGYAKYVGRVGALAVALGVGAAVATSPGVVWAQEPGDTASTDPGGQTSQPSDPDPGVEAPAVDAPVATTGATSQNQKPTDEPAAAEPGSGDPGSAVSVDLGDGVVVSSSGGAIETDEEEPEPTAVPEAGLNPKPAAAPTDGGGGAGSVAAAVPANQPVTQPDSGVGVAVTASVEPTIQTVTVDAPASLAVGQAPLVVAGDGHDARLAVSGPEPTLTAVDVATGVLATLLSPFAGIDPNAPVDSPLMWVLAAAARRQFGSARDAGEVSTLGLTGDVDNGQMTMMSSAALVTEELLAPEPDAVFGEPDPTTGTITGTVVPPVDPAGRTPTYTVTGAPAEGKLTFSRTTGKFTYTPTAAQRVLAGLSDAADDPNDSIDFTVSVRYGTDAATPLTVSIPMAPTPIADVKTIATGNGSLGIAVTNTRAYVTNGDAGTVTVIDTINRIKLGTINIDGYPQGVAVSPDGKKLYVASQATDTATNKVTVINTADNSVITTVDLGVRSPDLMAISPAGGTLYVTTTTYDEDDFVVSSQIVKISTATNRVVGTVNNVGLVPYQITVSPKGTKIFVISEIETDSPQRQTGVFVFSSTGTTGKQILGVGEEPESLDVSADGKRLYVGDWDTGKITIVDTTLTTYKVLGSFDTANETIDELVINKDGTLLLVLNAATHAVDVYDVSDLSVLTGGVYAPLESVPTDSTTAINWPEAVLSPDGMEMYFTSDGAVQIISLVPPNTHPDVAPPAPPAPPNATTGALTGDIGVSDPDDDPLSYTVTGAPARGKVVINADGTFTYTPTALARHAASADGAGTELTTDTFTITVSDGRRGIVTQTITVAIDPANKVPTYRRTVGTPGTTTGKVTGSVVGYDGDRDKLTYTASTVDPAKGTLTLNANTGAFTYTPTTTARHLAAVTGAPLTDTTNTFTVTIDDGHGSTVDVPVTARVRPLNAVPVSTGSLGQPNMTTGVVTGAITTTNTDNDTLTYSSTPTPKGALDFNADGTFTFTPTAEARAAAAVRPASLATRTEKFTVTINDGHGGTDTVTLTATIAALGNTAPVVTQVSQNPPSVYTGSITGRVTATDAEGDTRTYSGSAITARGKVTVNSTGTFTYTPTSAARHAAAALDADPAIKTDSFTVTVVDGYGGSTTQIVNVDILGKNSVPTYFRATATSPDPNTAVVGITLSATDADHDTLTYSGPASTVKGNVIQTGTNTFTYTPTAAARAAAGATGATTAAKTDILTFTVTDGHGGTKTVNKTVSILPDPPVSNTVDPAPVDGFDTGPNVVGTTGRFSA